MAGENKFTRILWIGATWLVTLLVAFVFATQGWAKFFSNNFWARSFAHWGYPVWFRILIGVAECVAAALLLVPRLAAYGATLVIAIMLGGVATNLRAGEPRQMVAPLVWMVLASIILIVRRRIALRFASKRAPSASQ